MSRTCYVIMPFSATSSCKTRQWTWIYKNIFKKAIESAGLDYECKRSTATRGSIIKGIIKDLDESWVVLADLTDKNPNIFYELGIRHSLHPKTILVAQRRTDIPFDLRGYASHIYKWDTEIGRRKFGNKIKSLLQEIGQAPERPDSPVLDFLVTTAKDQSEIKEKTSTPEEVKTIIGPGTKKLNILELVRKLKK